MAAIDSKHLIEIVAINLQSGVSRKTGQPYKIHKAQCVVRGPDNSASIGELNVTEEIAAKTPPGRYLAEFELAVSFDRLVVPRVTALHAWSGSLSSDDVAPASKPTADKSSSRASA